jgi:hypothetical protein
MKSYLVRSQLKGHTIMRAMPRTSTAKAIRFEVEDMRRPEPVLPVVEVSDTFTFDTARGIERRLRAGLRSFGNRGFESADLVLTPSGRFDWSSYGGVWSPRCWRLSGYWNFSTGKVEDARFTVSSGSDRFEQTTFYGHRLDWCVAKRLHEAIAIVGARTLIKEGGWHIETTCPIGSDHRGIHAAFMTGIGKAVLCDDDYGVSNMFGPRAAIDAIFQHTWEQYVMR